MAPDALGRMLIVTGLVIVVFGLLLVAGDRIPFVGRMPGTITLSRDNFTLVVPLGLSIVLSIVLTVVINLVMRR